MGIENMMQLRNLENRPDINNCPEQKLKHATSLCKQKENKFIPSKQCLIDVCFGGKRQLATSESNKAQQSQPIENMMQLRNLENRPDIDNCPAPKLEYAITSCKAKEKKLIP